MMTRNSAKLKFKVGRVTLSGRQPGLALNGDASAIIAMILQIHGISDRYSKYQNVDC